jgi:hypothetical protein
MFSTSSRIKKNKGQENEPPLPGAGPYWMGQACCPGLSDPAVPDLFYFFLKIN